MSTLGTLFDLLLVVAGFGLIIVFHELGHFLAARWAGVRVLAFAVGFGPAIFSWRKGLGFRRGSSDAEYQALMARRARGESNGPELSSTEYRLNVFPFGGYVKMLGQDDSDPSHRSNAPDSFTSASVPRRMVIISAGVAANVAVAALLFMLVFMVGLRTEPAKVGDVSPGSPAATATAANAAALGITEPGLLPGDEILAIDGRKPNSFNDLMLASAMARRGQELELRVQRPGIPEPLVFRMTPREDPLSKMLQLGVGPAASAQVASPRRPSEREAVARGTAEIGLTGVEPGMTLLRVGDQPVNSVDDLTRAVRLSEGRPVTATFASGDARQVQATVQPTPQLQSTLFMIQEGVAQPTQHILGLAPAMQVAHKQDASTFAPAERAGLRRGDIFVRIGAAEWPTVPEGMAEIRRNRRGTVHLTVARQADDGSEQIVDLGQVPVSRQGTIGFMAASTAGNDTLIASWPRLPRAIETTVAEPPAAAALQVPPGTRITHVNDQPVADFFQLRESLRRATADGQTSVQLTVELPAATTTTTADAATRARAQVTWDFPPGSVDRLHALGWESPVPAFLFQREQILLRAEGPIGAVAMGLHETHRVMMSTYLTFARLFHGTVKVEHLRGPVGIAHVGTIIAERGFIWLLFFLALVSVNLAVINFLPIPIADGGHMVFLIYEAVAGRPVSVAVQNAAALVGLVLIVGLFLVVTFNDISRLISP